MAKIPGNVMPGIWVCNIFIVYMVNSVSPIPTLCYNLLYGHIHCLKFHFIISFILEIEKNKLLEDITMAKKLNLREIGMDTMERLYYERQSARKKAYVSKKRKRGIPAKKTWPGQDFDISGKTLGQAI